MTAFYNEIEPYCVKWLGNLSQANLIAPGLVESKSIALVQPNELTTYTQAHFFAGIGVWSYALKLVGWPDSVPVWTGSCPCQPFSRSGQKRGFADARHLWPEWFRLIKQQTPPILFGEQVASPDGLKWLDLVSSDLENEGYSFASADLPAAGIGAPHKRSRIFFVAYLNNQSDTRFTTYLRQWRVFKPQAEKARESATNVQTGQLGNTHSNAAKHVQHEHSKVSGSQSQSGNLSLPVGSRDASSLLAGFWSDCEWVYCKDGKTRPIEPSVSPLVNGSPKDLDRLRALGNAIVAPVAAEFIACSLEAIEQILV